MGEPETAESEGRAVSRGSSRPRALRGGGSRSPTRSTGWRRFVSTRERLRTWCWTHAQSLRSWQSYTPGTNLRAWLLRIPTNLNVDRGRWLQRRPDETPLEEHDYYLRQRPRRVGRRAGPRAGPCRRAALPGLDRTALSALPDDFRDVVVLVDIGDFPYPDAAQILDFPSVPLSRLHAGGVLKAKLAGGWAGAMRVGREQLLEGSLDRELSLEEVAVAEMHLEVRLLPPALPVRGVAAAVRAHEPPSGSPPVSWRAHAAPDDRSGSASVAQQHPPTLALPQHGGLEVTSVNGPVARRRPQVPVERDREHRPRGASQNTRDDGDEDGDDEQRDRDDVRARREAERRQHHRGNDAEDGEEHADRRGARELLAPLLAEQRRRARERGERAEALEREDRHDEERRRPQATAAAEEEVAEQAGPSRSACRTRLTVVRRSAQPRIAPTHRLATAIPPRTVASRPSSTSAAAAASATAK